MTPTRSDAGFTLIELMVVVAIIGIQAGVIIPRLGDRTRFYNEHNAEALLHHVRTQERDYFETTTPGRFATARQMFEDGEIGESDASSLGVATSVVGTSALDSPTGGRSSGYQFTLLLGGDGAHYRLVATPAAAHRTGYHIFTVEDLGPVTRSCPAGQTEDQQGACTPGDTSHGTHLLSTILLLDSYSQGAAIPMAISHLQTSDLQSRVLAGIDANADGIVTLEETVNADVIGLSRRLARGLGPGKQPLVTDRIVKDLLTKSMNLLRGDAGLGVAGAADPGLPLSDLKGDAVSMLEILATYRKP
jgi:prepilin-type N-terminal cleavage/methylation domain-containing protein